MNSGKLSFCESNLDFIERKWLFGSRNQFETRNRVYNNNCPRLLNIYTGKIFTTYLSIFVKSQCGILLARKLWETAVSRREQRKNAS